MFDAVQNQFIFNCKNLTTVLFAKYEKKVNGRQLIYT